MVEGQGNLRYKIWNPLDHWDHKFVNGVDDKDGVWSMETLDLGAGGDPSKGIAAISHNIDLRDYGLSEERYNELLAADCRAEEILNSLRRGTIPDGVACISENNGKQEVNTTYIYSCPVSDTQELEVKVRINQKARGYEILRWKIVSTVSWEREDTLNLWDGEAEQEE